MLAVQVGCGYMSKTQGCATGNDNKRRREDDGEHIDEGSKRQKVMGKPKPKSLVKSISVDEAAELLYAIKTASKSKTLSVTRAEPYLLKKKREAARASLLAMKKEIHNPEDNWETFEQFRMLIGGHEVGMSSFDMHPFGKEEEEPDCSGAIKTPSSCPSNEPLRLMIKRAQQKLLEKKREAARVSLLEMEKEIDNPEDNLETFEQLRMLCDGDEVVMGSFDMHPFGVDLILKKEEEEEEEQDCSCSGLSQLSAINTPSSPSKPPPKPKLAMTTVPQHLLLPKKREAARLLGMEKEVDKPEDYLITFEKRIRMLGGRRELPCALVLRSLILLKKG